MSHTSFYAARYLLIPQPSLLSPLRPKLGGIVSMIRYTSKVLMICAGLLLLPCTAMAGEAKGPLPGQRFISLQPAKNRAAVNKMIPIAPARFFPLAQGNRPLAPNVEATDYMESDEVITEKAIASNDPAMTREQAQQILSIFNPAD